MSTNFHFAVSDWSALWATDCHLIWTWRNKRLHDPLFISPQNLISEIQKHDTLYRFSSSLIRSTRHVHRFPLSLCWCPPPLGWVCLNSDGVCKDNFGASCGGLFQNNFGRWIGGFHKFLGECSSILAELWGVLVGLEFAWKNNFKKIIMQVDNKKVVDVLADVDMNIHQGSSLARRCILLLLHNFEDVTFKHVFLEKKPYVLTSWPSWTFLDQLMKFVWMII